MRENRRNPSGYGHSAPDTASLLLEVASTTPASSLLVPTRTGQYRGWRYLRDRFFWQADDSCPSSIRTLERDKGVNLNFDTKQQM